jgi:chorismate mutase/prephenate dehydratase
MKIGYQGIAGAYSEMASKKFFTSNDDEFVGCQTFDEIFDKVDGGELDFGVVPIENSLAGSIHRNIDLLNRHNLKIIGEIYLKVEHNLLGLKDSKLEDIKEVYSHWQALAQCERTLKRELPRASIKEHFDTAGAARFVSEQNDKTKASVSSKLASEIYGLEILKENIQDDNNNYTRFVIISKKYLKDLEVDKKYKTSITFSGKSVPGFLYSILKNFAEHNINLTKIESRPIPNDTWNYFFYIDFEGRFDDKEMVQILQKTAELTNDLKVLGSYTTVH